MSTLVPLAQATRARCGGKADGLRRLLQHGLPVPPGVCLPVEIYRQALPAVLPRQHRDETSQSLERHGQAVRRALEGWEPPTELANELQRAIDVHGALAVRSSATCEDREVTAPGLFETVTGVDHMGRLVDAIRRCWCSLWSVSSWLVLRRHHRWPGGEAMGLVLQRQLRPVHAGLALSIDPGAEDCVLVEAVEGEGEAVASGTADPVSFSLPRKGEVTAAAASELPGDALRALRDAVLVVESVWGTTVELEWAVTDTLWLLQARSCASEPLAGGDIGWSAAGDPGVRWRWDREHNPEPLSPAHTSLIELLDPLGESVRVVEGYLFEVDRGGDEADAGELDSLWQRFNQRVLPGLQALEQQAGREDPGRELRRAVELFVELHRAYFGELSSARRTARRSLVDLLRGLGLARAVERAAELAGVVDHETLARTIELYRLAARVRGDGEARQLVARDDTTLESCPPWLREALEAHLARYGTLFPVWDIAIPTLAERPVQLLVRLRGLLDVERDPGVDRTRQLERGQALEREVMARVAADDRPRARVLLEGARLARRLEEADDLLFSRALALVRRGLLRIGDAWQQSGRLARAEQVFLYSLPDIQQSLATGASLPAESAAHRLRLWEAQRDLSPPWVIQGDGVRAGRGGEQLRGLGVGGTARGQVRLVSRMEQLLERDLRGAVVVCPTLLPALAVVLPEVAALVTDHGGLLSHAASLARELGVVAVVGTGRATRVLREGETVWVDGRRGLVISDRA